MNEAIHLFSEIAKLARTAQRKATTDETRQTAVEIKMAAECARDSEVLSKNPPKQRMTDD